MTGVINEYLRVNIKKPLVLPIFDQAFHNVIISEIQYINVKLVNLNQFYDNS